MATFGVTDTGFTLKRFHDIREDIRVRLAAVQDPITGENLTPDLADENDPLVNLVNAVADQLSVCWEQLEMAYNQFDPLKASGAGLSGLVQLNGVLRDPAEIDTTLRLRQQLETSLTSYRQVESIFSGLVDIDGVQFARVYQNSTLQDPDSRGIPAKSVCAVVVGGDDQLVGEQLFEKSPLGVDYFGNTTVTVLDSQNIAYDVKFQRPTVVPITIVVNIQVIDNSVYPANGPDLIKAAIVTYSQYGLAPDIGIPPGSDVINTRLYTPVNTVNGHRIYSILIAKNEDAPAEQDITIDWDEVAEFTTSRITVNLV